MTISRRTILRGVLGTAATAVTCPSSATESREAPKSTNPDQRATLPNSCFANLNQFRRFQITGFDDLAGRTRFPFLDTRQVRDIQGAELRFHPAIKHGDPVVVADRPWELGTHLNGSVHHDGRRFRMWYEPIPPAGERQGKPYYVVCYAESSDGIHWEKPELGVTEIQGTRKNNLVSMRGHCPNVVDLGDNAPPERRYFGVTVAWPPVFGVPELLNDARTSKLSSYWAFYSADGIDWKLYPVPDCAIVPNMSDNASFIIDPARGRLLGGVKLEPRIGLYDRRSISITTASLDNVLDWEAPRLSLFPDDLDDRMARERGCHFAEFYGMGLFSSRDLLIGFPEVFYVRGELHPSQPAGSRIGYHGNDEIQLAYSYDGYAWQRPPGRPAFIPLGKPGDWDDGFLIAHGAPAVEVGDEVFVYYSGMRGGHSVSEETDRGKIGLAKVKRDRFASIHCGSAGMVEVYHGKPRGRSLLVNARTAVGGQLHVEARYFKGKQSEPIGGFGLMDCDPITGDDLRFPVSWGDKTWANLPRDREIVLRFRAQTADLFAYEVVS